MGLKVFMEEKLVQDRAVSLVLFLNKVSVFELKLHIITFVSLLLGK